MDTLQTILEKMKTGSTSVCLNVERSYGKFSFELFIDFQNPQGEKVGTIYKLRETRHGYTVETLCRADWNAGKSRFEHLHTVDREEVYNKRGLKVFKDTVSVIHDALRFKYNTFFGDSVRFTAYYSPRDVFKKDKAAYS